MPDVTAAARLQVQAHSTGNIPRSWGHRFLGLTLLAFICPPAFAAETPWAEVGRQGVVRFVVVPVEQARDREAYSRQLTLICPTSASCFVNFYTNTSGAELTMPLPAAVEKEATATFRRSSKQGAELFRWSCRLELDPVNCF